MWQHGLSFAAHSTTGICAPKPTIMESAFLREIRLATYQRHCRCSQSQLGVKGEQLVRISALCESLPLNHLPKEASDIGRREGSGEEDLESYADKIKEIKKLQQRLVVSQVTEKQNLGISSNFPRREESPGSFP